VVPTDGSLRLKVTNRGSMARQVSLCIFLFQFIHAALLDAMRDFALAEANWYSTWPNNVEDRAMIVYVKCMKGDLFWLT